MAGRTIPLLEIAAQMAGQGNMTDALRSMILDVATRRSFAATDGAPLKFFHCYLQITFCDTGIALIEPLNCFGRITFLPGSWLLRS